MAKCSYNPHTFPQIVEYMMRCEKTVKETCKILGISEASFYNYLNSYREFRESYVRGKEYPILARFKREKELDMLCEGYKVQNVRTKVTNTPDGVKITEKIIDDKTYPPNLDAIKWVQKNRDSERWKERQNEISDDEIPTTGIKFEVRTDD